MSAASLTSVGAGGAFTARGLGALLRPAQVQRPFGIAQLPLDARNPVRAVYGGFGLAMAALLLLGLAGPDLRPDVVLTVAVALLGVAAGRRVSWAADRASVPIRCCSCASRRDWPQFCSAPREASSLRQRPRAMLSPLSRFSASYRA